jgi:hypothetical protein
MKLMCPAALFLLQLLSEPYTNSTTMNKVRTIGVICQELYIQKLILVQNYLLFEMTYVSGQCSMARRSRRGEQAARGGSRARLEGQRALLGPCLVDPSGLPRRHCHGLLDARVQGLPVPIDEISHLTAIT